MSSFGKIVLDYGDYLIRESEMTILKTNQWLNDVIIGFYIEYLSREVFPEGTSKIKLMGPEMTQLLKLCGTEDLANLMGDIAEYEFVCFPVNNFDEPDQTTFGGSHWSLLVYSRLENVMAHYDSSYGTNNVSAESLCTHISNVIHPKPSFSSRGCVAQENGYDCGLHVLANIEAIVNYVLHSKVLNGVHTAKPDAVGKLRTKIVNLIEKKTHSSTPGDQ